MRTCRYFAVWADGQVVAIVHGYKGARRLSPCRAYRSFKNQLAAELFCDYWNHQVAVKFLADCRAEADALSAKYRPAKKAVPSDTAFTSASQGFLSGRFRHPRPMQPGLAR